MKCALAEQTAGVAAISGEFRALDLQAVAAV
jgi:hypothetical protein